MEGTVVADPKHEAFTRMPEGIMPPETLYRFKPNRNSYATK